MTEPELRTPTVPLDVDVNRLRSIGGIEVEPVRAYAEDCRHRPRRLWVLRLAR